MTLWKPICDSPNEKDMKKIFQVLFTRENLLAILLCLILIALVIFTADTSPTWIYQGF
jgi:lipopolysaccharide/colanic/teichoic acid biosynthesis glycosyltransferase